MNPCFFNRSFRPGPTATGLVFLASKDGIAELIYAKADFDGHRGLIREVFPHATVGGLLGALAATGREGWTVTSPEVFP